MLDEQPIRTRCIVCDYQRFVKRGGRTDSQIEQQTDYPRCEHGGYMKICATTTIIFRSLG
ncbi:MAG TPA: hypothetical protein VII92_14805 [Anaerolineae bacterium]